MDGGGGNAGPYNSTGHMAAGGMHHGRRGGKDQVWRAVHDLENHSRGHEPPPPPQQHLKQNSHHHMGQHSVQQHPGNTGHHMSQQAVGSGGNPIGGSGGNSHIGVHSQGKIGSVRPRPQNRRTRNPRLFASQPSNGSGGSSDSENQDRNLMGVNGMATANATTVETMGQGLLQHNTGARYDELNGMQAVDSQNRQPSQERLRQQQQQLLQDQGDQNIIPGDSGISALQASDDELQQLLHEAVLQREQAQRIEAERRGTVMARADMNRLRATFESERKGYAEVEAALQAQLQEIKVREQEKDEQLSKLQQRVKQLDQQLKAHQDEIEKRVWQTEGQLQEKANELAVLRRERDGALAEGKAQASQREAERNELLAEMEQLKQELAARDQQLREQQDQMRVAQEEVWQKDEQLRETQTWASHHGQDMELAVGHHQAAAQSLAAELRDRTEQYNQLFMAHHQQRNQLLESDRYHTQVIQRLQQDNSELREKLRKFSPDGSDLGPSNRERAAAEEAAKAKGSKALLQAISGAGRPDAPNTDSQVLPMPVGPMPLMQAPHMTGPHQYGLPMGAIPPQVQQVGVGQVAPPPLLGMHMGPMPKMPPQQHLTQGPLTQMQQQAPLSQTQGSQLPHLPPQSSTTSGKTLQRQHPQEGEIPQQSHVRAPQPPIHPPIQPPVQPKHNNNHSNQSQIQSQQQAHVSHLQQQHQNSRQPQTSMPSQQHKVSTQSVSQQSQLRKGSQALPPSPSGPHSGALGVQQDHKESQEQSQVPSPSLHSLTSPAPSESSQHQQPQTTVSQQSQPALPLGRTSSQGGLQLLQHEQGISGGMEHLSVGSIPLRNSLSQSTPIGSQANPSPSPSPSPVPTPSSQHPHEVPQTPQQQTSSSPKSQVPSQQPSSSVSRIQGSQTNQSVSRTPSPRQEQQSGISGNSTSGGQSLPLLPLQQQQKVGEAGKMTESNVKLMDERTLLAHIVRTIPADPAAKNRISTTVTNRLTKLLAPLTWNDYVPKFGRLEEFIASHPELFVLVDGDSVYLKEGARNIIASQTSTQRPIAPPLPTPGTGLLAVTPVASQFHSHRNRGTRVVGNGNVGVISLPGSRDGNKPMGVITQIGQLLGPGSLPGSHGTVGSGPLNGKNNQIPNNTQKAIGSETQQQENSNPNSSLGTTTSGSGLQTRVNNPIGVSEKSGGNGGGNGNSGNTSHISGGGANEGSQNGLGPVTDGNTNTNGNGNGRNGVYFSGRTQGRVVNSPQVVQRMNTQPQPQGQIQEDK